MKVFVFTFYNNLVGDCWLLSAISALSEYEGAVAKLFSKTKDIHNLPLSDSSNKYIVTLYDLKTWYIYLS